MGIGGRSKDGKGENAMRSGITRRWLQGSLLITVLLVLLVLSALLILCDGIVCRTTRGMTHLIGKQEVVK